MKKAHLNICARDAVDTTREHNTEDWYISLFEGMTCSCSVNYNTCGTVYVAVELLKEEAFLRNRFWNTRHAPSKEADINIENKTRPGFPDSLRSSQHLRTF